MITLPRQFKSFNEAFAQIALELINDGQDVDVANAVGDTVMTKELQDYQVVFAPEYVNVCTLPQRKFPIKGAHAEFLWYMTGNPNAKLVAEFLPNWLNYANEDGTVNSNYGKYWLEAVPGIIEELKRDKMSRRAVMNIYNYGNAPFGKDTPCTLTLQFMIRKNRATGEDQLNLICMMRSNDIWYGLSIDQFCNSLLHQLVHHSLLDTYPNLKIGTYSHHAGSMHVYVSSSKGNATISPKLLGDMYMQFMSNPSEVGERFALPENVTFENFWETAGECFDKKRFQYFKDILTNSTNI